MLWVWSLIVITMTAAAADPVTVRFPEGETHGFLVLRSLQGQILAYGELTALAHGDRMESRFTWRFRDGSFQDEFITYLQRPVLKLLSYKQIQRGPSFPADIEVAFTRDPNHYELKQREKGKKDTEEFSGTLELPADVYNGMTATLLNNLAKGEIATGHLVAFTPKPRLVKVTYQPVGEDPVIIGDSRRGATRRVREGRRKRAARSEVLGPRRLPAGVREVRGSILRPGPDLAHRALRAPLAHQVAA